MNGIGRNSRIFLIFIFLLAHNPLSTQSDECKIYEEMTVYLRDSVTLLSKVNSVYVWKEKQNSWPLKGIVKSYKEEGYIDSCFQAKEEGLTTEWNKFAKFTCRLDKILPVKYTKNKKDWSNEQWQKNLLAHFSEIIYDKTEQQAFCNVVLYSPDRRVRIYYYFSFNKINGIWTIKKTGSWFRV